MVYEMLVGLNVVNEQKYQNYRNEMKPILSSFGGGFGCDFKVSEVLQPQKNSDINRVFTIYFPDIMSKEAFFTNPEYLEIKKQYFEGAVGSTTIFASYEKDS